MKHPKGLAATIACVFNWPMLWTRLYTTGILIFSCYELRYLREANSDSRISNALSEGYQWMIMLVLLMYMSKNGASIVVGMVGRRFGVTTEMNNDRDRKPNSEPEKV